MEKRRRVDVKIDKRERIKNKQNCQIL